MTSVLCSLQEAYEKKKQEHVADMQKKEEDMRQMFVVRVKEKEAELKEAEKEVRTTHAQAQCIGPTGALASGDLVIYVHRGP